MTDDIAAFIRARLDEDEEIAKGAAYVHGELWASAPDHVTYIYNTKSETDHVVRHDPARVLRGVDAKRRIVGSHHPNQPADEWYWTQRECADCGHFWHRITPRPPQPEIGLEVGCPTLRALASEWSTHPDYRQEWTP